MRERYGTARTMKLRCRSSQSYWNPAVPKEWGSCRGWRRSSNGEEALSLYILQEKEQTKWWAIDRVVNQQFIELGTGHLGVVAVERPVDLWLLLL